jgi:amidase
MTTDPEQLLKQGGISQIRTALVERRFPAVEIAQACLDRIEKISEAGPQLNAMRSVSTTALEQAERLDQTLSDGIAPGPLHGIPVLLKDNIQTNDGLPMSAGAMALREFYPRREATIVTRLRRAGAIIMGKTNLTEFADYVSDVMPSGFSGLGGIVRNPHGTQYGRGGGSSVGSAAAVAAGIVPVALGSETQNSIQTPACNTSIVGFKPSVGRVSRAGMFPLVPSQDSPGPLTRSVEDSWIVYSAISGPDPADTQTFRPSFLGDQRLAHIDDFSSIRLGAPRITMTDREDIEPVLHLFEDALSKLSNAGIHIVDPCDLPSAERLRDVRSSVFPTEFKAALNEFLIANGRPNGIGSIDELIAWNEAHEDAIPYGQPLLLAARDSGDLDQERYGSDRLRDVALSRQSGIDAALAAGDVDTLIVPMSVAAKCTGKAGAPVMAIPVGLDDAGAPFGVTIFTRYGDDARLFAVARAIEDIIGDLRRPVLAEFSVG